MSTVTRFLAQATSSKCGTQGATTFQEQILLKTHIFATPDGKSTKSFGMNSALHIWRPVSWWYRAMRSSFLHQSRCARRHSIFPRIPPRFTLPASLTLLLVAGGSGVGWIIQKEDFHESTLLSIVFLAHTFVLRILQTILRNRETTNVAQTPTKRGS